LLNGNVLAITPRLIWSVIRLPAGSLATVRAICLPPNLEANRVENYGL
jgi:hypothetical protein